MHRGVYFGAEGETEHSSLVSDPIPEFTYKRMERRWALQFAQGSLKIGSLFYYRTFKNDSGMIVDPHEGLEGVEIFHRAAFGTVSAGNLSVVDLVLRKEHWWRECAELFKGHQTMIVQVRCSLEELERRERDRGDREIGMARWQCANMANSSLCDFEVDTTRLSTTEAVDAMLVHLSTQPRLAALGNYRRAEPR